MVLEMKLIVGLGNPGRQYARHRHNVGFKAIDRLADHHGIRGEKRKFHSIMAQGDILGTPCVLLRPTTYMNRSGMAVCAALHYYKLDPDDSLVVVDDTALPCGQIRLRAAGSTGGHNGLADIELGLKTRAFPRLRIGVDDSGLVPQDQYVLSPFTSEQLERLEPAIEQACACIESWTNTDIDAVMAHYNART